MKNPKTTIIIDAGVNHLHIKVIKDKKTTRLLIPNNDTIQNLFQKNDLLELINQENTTLYITGKLAEIIQKTVKKGEIVLPSAALWSEAKFLVNEHQKGSSSRCISGRTPSLQINSLGIIDLSASGYMIIAINKEGKLKNDLLITNPRCGAGSGINLDRILEKLDIQRNEIDNILKEYLGEDKKEARAGISVRADRCGVFSSSATISDKNQGIPLEKALAVTMKSEALKSCKKMLPSIDKVYLTGRVFNWQFVKNCAEDYLSSIGVKEIIYDDKQSILLNGTEHLIKSIGEKNFKKQETHKLRREEKILEYPSFSELKNKYQKAGLFKRIPDPKIPESNLKKLFGSPVNIGLDVGSTMAKCIITNASSPQRDAPAGRLYNDYNSEILFKGSYSNHGDTVETIKYIFRDIQSQGLKALNIQNIGITGSGRYQVQKVLQEVYPQIKDNITVLVENYAHVHGSIKLAKKYLEEIARSDPKVNQDFCILVDIGGEDTKISVISLKKEELFDNVMNIKCSAGTGSLMDTLKALFGIKEINEACNRAYEAKKAYEINATCAVFLMENAKKMQALGYSKDEILASCNYAIVENMARTLWNQIEMPPNALVLLHGQTMLSDPLPLAVTHRIQESGKKYCLVPPLPGHRACLGLIKRISNFDF